VVPVVLLFVPVNPLPGANGSGDCSSFSIDTTADSDAKNGAKWSRISFQTSKPNYLKNGLAIL
jgi:hypothetical protein